MKSYYLVNFMWNNTHIYCANIAYAENLEAVKERYTSKYGWCVVRNITDEELKYAKAKGMPVIEI